MSEKIGTCGHPVTGKQRCCRPCQRQRNRESNRRALSRFKQRKQAGVTRAEAVCAACHRRPARQRSPICQPCKDTARLAYFKQRHALAESEAVVAAKLATLDAQRASPWLRARRLAGEAA